MAGIKEANKVVGAVGLVKAPGVALVLVDNPLDNKAEQAGQLKVKVKVDMAAAPVDMVAAAATVMDKVVALWEVAMNNRAARFPRVAQPGGARRQPQRRQDGGRHLRLRRLCRPGHAC